MSFIFSRALVEESLRVSCRETDAYAPLNLIPTPKPSLSLGKTTAPFLRSRFGMTFEPLTADLGEELLTSWLAGFHARTSAQRAPATGLTANEADSGPKWLGSFAKYNPSESKWKTAQCSLLGDSDEFSETWPRWGSMRNGESFLRPIPKLHTCASASGLWPTPTATDTKGHPAEKRLRERMMESSRGVRLSEELARRGHLGPMNPEWVEWLMGWPIGHTALKPLETAKYREWLQQHSPFSHDEY